MAKKTNRTKELQEYRDNLAQWLKQLRNDWEVWKDLAKTLLEDGKSTIEYLDSIKEDKSDNLADNWEWTEIINPHSTEDLIENWEWDIEPSGMPLALNSEKNIITPVLYENSHMKATLQKISTTNLQETADNIISTYDEQWHCVVNFIYEVHSTEDFNNKSSRNSRQYNFYLWWTVTLCSKRYLLLSNSFTTSFFYS